MPSGQETDRVYSTAAARGCINRKLTFALPTTYYCQNSCLINLVLTYLLQCVLITHIIDVWHRMKVIHDLILQIILFI